MNYTQKLTLSMLVPTFMVAGAGGTVALGAWWLQGQAHAVSPDTMAGYLVLGGVLTALLTVFCVGACIGFTVWIRRTARRVLGGEPSVASEALGALADGNLALQVSSDQPGSLMHSLQRLVESLRTSVGDIRSAAQGITLASGQIADGNHDLSQRTERAASNLEETAASMHALTDVIRQAAASSGEANRLARAAADVAGRGGELVGQVVVNMNDIGQGSRKVREIIGVINGIAFQTNILALNAAVEAARAGELGRGFAVVAGEVRTLAQRSAQAAKEIENLIGDSVARVDSGAQLVQTAGDTMAEIVGSIRRASEIIGEISAASGEQARGVGEVNEAIGQIDQMTQQNAALVEESSAAAASLMEQARRLEQAVQGFRL